MPPRERKAAGEMGKWCKNAYALVDTLNFCSIFSSSFWASIGIWSKYTGTGLLQLSSTVFPSTEKGP